MVKAAAYLRRSTKDQSQSLERQRHEIERFAQTNGVEVVRWYQDDGISGVEDETRPGFQRMIWDAERNRDFAVILVHEISRFGRFDAFQSGSWLHRLKAARVRVQAIAGLVRDPYSIQGKLLLALEGDRQESFKLSIRTLSGQRETAMKGHRAGGKVPFGYARRLRRADGTVELVGRIGRAKRDKSEVIDLVPGDATEVEAVRSIFRWATEGSGFRTIAARLNDRGIPSPDVARKTIATTPGRWVATTVRAILLNPAYAGDAVWNVRSMPKFHRLQHEQIVEVDDAETRRFQRNDPADWVVKRNAHPALVERAVFDAVRERFRSHPSMPRGHRYEYLLTGCMKCACGEVMTGMTRNRRKMTAAGIRVHTESIYACAGAFRVKGACKQIGLPRDAFEEAVLRILDEEVFSPEGLTRLEVALRREAELRDRSPQMGEVAILEKREREMAQKVAEGAKRLLLVDDAVVAEVRAALAEMKIERDRLRAALDDARRTTVEPQSVDELVASTLGSIRSMAAILRDPAVPLDRRREVVRRLLPAGPSGERPIRVEFDLNAGRGWRRALRRVTVRHLSLRMAKVPKVVAGTVAAVAEHAYATGRRDPIEDLPVVQRELALAEI